MNSTYIIIGISVLVAIIAAVAVYYFFFTENKEAIALEYFTKIAKLVKDKKYKEVEELGIEFAKKYPKIDAANSDKEFKKKINDYMAKDDMASASKFLATLM